MKRNGNSAFSFESHQTTSKMNFNIAKLIITFKKYLKTIHGQSALEYSLLLIVIAALSLAIILPAISEEAGHTNGNAVTNPIREAVNRINSRVIN